MSKLPVVPAGSATILDLRPKLPPRRELSFRPAANEGNKNDPFVGVTPRVDLTGKRKACFVVGLGSVGKSTWLTWMLERDGVELGKTVLASILPSYENEKAQAYHALVERFGESVMVPQVADTATWLAMLLSAIMQDGEKSIAIDFGAGGEAALIGLCGSLSAHGLLAAMDEAGLAPVLVCPFSPREDDLAPFAALTEVGFTPAATMLLPNMGRITGPLPPTMAFNPLRDHSVYQTALGRGAVEVWIPLCHGMHAVDRLHIRKTAENPAASPAELFDKHRLSTWRQAMESAFRPVIEKGWLL